MRASDAYNEIQVFVLQIPVAKMRIMNTEHETVLRFSIFFFFMVVVESYPLIENVCKIHDKATACISSTMRVSHKAYMHMRMNGHSRSILPLPLLLLASSLLLVASKETGKATELCEAKWNNVTALALHRPKKKWMTKTVSKSEWTKQKPEGKQTE